MTTRKRRAAFDPNALNDLDELLPPLNLVRDAAAAGSATAVNTERDNADQNGVATAAQEVIDSNGDRAGRAHALAVVADDQPETYDDSDRGSVADEPAEFEKHTPAVTTQTGTDDKQNSPRRADARRKNVRKDSATTSANRVAPPEVALPYEVYGALRSLTLEERTANAVTARTYGQVVLDAVEEHADDLKTHWAGAVASASTGLFKRADGRPTRRRHNAPLSRVPLAGVINSDAALLDQLASDWGAGSRSALVEQALRLYLRVT